MFTLQNCLIAGVSFLLGNLTGASGKAMWDNQGDRKAKKIAAEITAGTRTVDGTKVKKAK